MMDKLITFSLSTDEFREALSFIFTVVYKGHSARKLNNLVFFEQKNEGLYLIAISESCFSQWLKINPFHREGFSFSVSKQAIFSLKRKLVKMEKVIRFVVEKGCMKVFSDTCGKGCLLETELSDTKLPSIESITKRKYKYEIEFEVTHETFSPVKSPMPLRKRESLCFSFGGKDCKIDNGKLPRIILNANWVNAILKRINGRSLFMRYDNETSPVIFRDGATPFRGDAHVLMPIRLEN